MSLNSFIAESYYLLKVTDKQNENCNCILITFIVSIYVRNNEIRNNDVANLYYDKKIYLSFIKLFLTFKKFIKIQNNEGIKKNEFCDCHIFPIYTFLRNEDSG